MTDRLLKQQERLAELRRIAEAATPGPWIKDADKRYSVRSHWNPPRDGNVVGWRVCVVSGNGPQSDADWDYITEFNPKTTLALLDRIEALEAFVHAEQACRDHAATCCYYDWKPGACPDGVCKRLMRARDEAYRRALAVMDIADGGATHA